MLDQLGYDTVDALVEAAVPKSIRTQRPLGVPEARGEAEVLAHLREIAGQNQVKHQMIGQGFYGTHTPAVIRRNVLESPAWYTAYTPYQPEISQGRLEALLNFQQAVEDLTGLEIANASLLDEATAVAEAVALMWRASRAKSGYVVLDADLFGQSLAVARGRAEAIGLPVVVTDLSQGLRAGLDPHRSQGTLPDGDLVGVVVQQVGASGRILDARDVVAEAKDAGAFVTVATDLLALTLLVSPGELGADISVGSAQRFGVPLFYGGPHAAYMSVRKGLERQLPGRLVGVSVDADGAPGYRLALATREQHIRRERATSNICTAQALLAIVAGMYAVYHGPEGLKAIAERVHAHASTIADTLRTAGIEIEHTHFFDTIRAVVPGKAAELASAAAEAGYNIHVPDANHIQLSCDETTTSADVESVTHSLLTTLGKTAPTAATATHGPSTPLGGNATTEAGSEEVPSATVSPNGGPPGARECVAEGTSPLPAELSRTTPYLQHPIFHTHRSETSLMRYMRKLSDKDLALDRTMIPLGSCTMKLNAAVEMESISWPEFANIHPYAPADQAEGYAELISALESQLADITGYAAVSVQPNAGSQGEFAGLLAIKEYHRSLGQQARDIVLIPASAHGTNAASAALAGLRVVVVKTADDGEILLDDLRAKLEQHGSQVSAIMITYPSTHGVYEEHVREVCDLVHGVGGQVYIDGANLNALVGLARPGEFGGDVSHLNLHKTFCIPHGGGGPGVGPVAVAEHLVPFLPGNPVAPSSDVVDGSGTRVTPISGTNHGSAGILPISYAYLALMGPDGLTEATKAAVLTANYVSSRLADHFPTLYTGPSGLVAHECILDLRDLTARTGVTAADVAKRLQDYGFHAPTLAFPVAGTLMVEPTESEDLAELDRFVDAMIAIRAEIDDVAAGRWAVEDSPLRGAPHTAASVSATEWDKPYSRETAAYPLPGLRHDKYWPPVRRIDDAHGDRNLVCSCPPVEAFEGN
ncbi:aminomethyl-transferring glycine dehydrogenase subunit GcvPB [Myceligenerans halotolerans]